MGKDGKTGETRMKTVLAPMFQARNLTILSWEGHNLLGNRDGETLHHPANNLAQVRDEIGFPAQMEMLRTYARKAAEDPARAAREGSLSPM